MSENTSHWPYQRIKAVTESGAYLGEPYPGIFFSFGINIVSTFPSPHMSLNLDIKGSNN